MIVALIEDRNDILVTQPGGGTGLPVELRHEIGIVTQAVVHHLDGDDAFEAAVPGTVDGGHPASCEPLQDLVAPVQHITNESVGGGPGHNGSICRSGKLTVPRGGRYSV
ncbi:hypothetical protein SDC9_197240 [bioreactor metagenome]|uniref:Uncharacterized protein n=1 Tax=bioreactor metagenome TaxID=1076179 RepID=A0A645IE71_9ZZZZ